MYPLMEKHAYARQMQAEMIREIEGAQPESFQLALDGHKNAFPESLEIAQYIRDHSQKK